MMKIRAPFLFAVLASGGVALGVVSLVTDDKKVDVQGTSKQANNIPNFPPTQQKGDAIRLDPPHQIQPQANVNDEKKQINISPIENTSINVDSIVSSSQQQKMQALQGKLVKPSVYKKNDTSIGENVGDLSVFKNSTCPKIIELVAIEKFLDNPLIFQSVVSGVLRRDRENRYDCNAIAVCNDDGAQIAFVAKTFAQEIAPLMDRGWKYRIETVQGSYISKKWGMCNARIISEMEPEYIKEQSITAKKIGMIYHMTHIDNLENIFECGIRPKNRVRELQRRDIADNDVQTRRDSRSCFGHKLHDCVPFYINVRNAMMYRVVQENARNIVVVGIPPQIYAQYEFFVSERNAATSSARFYKGVDKTLIDELPWNEIYQASWLQDGERNEERKQIMQSEVLIPNDIPLSCGSVIFCSNTETKKRVQEILDSYFKRDINVEIDSNMFFNMG